MSQDEKTLEKEQETVIDEQVTDIPVKEEIDYKYEYIRLQKEISEEKQKTLESKNIQLEKELNQIKLNNKSLVTEANATSFDDEDYFS